MTSPVSVGMLRRHAARRNRDAERVLLARLTPALRARIYNIALQHLGCPELAEDVTQDMLVRLWRTPQLLADEGAVLRGIIMWGKCQHALRDRGVVLGSGPSDEVTHDELRFE